MIVRCWPNMLAKHIKLHSNNTHCIWERLPPLDVCLSEMAGANNNAASLHAIFLWCWLVPTFLYHISILAAGGEEIVPHSSISLFLPLLHTTNAIQHLSKFARAHLHRVRLSRRKTSPLISAFVGGFVDHGKSILPTNQGVSPILPATQNGYWLRK